MLPRLKGDLSLQHVYNEVPFMRKSIPNSTLTHSFEHDFIFCHSAQDCEFESLKLVLVPLHIRSRHLTTATMAYQKIGVFFIALVICGQASAQGPISAPAPAQTPGAAIAPVSSPVAAPVLPPTVFTPTVAPPVSTTPVFSPSVAPTVAPPTATPVIPPSPVPAPVSEVPTPSSAELAPAPGPSSETSSAMMVSAAVWSVLWLSSGLLVALV